MHEAVTTRPQMRIGALAHDVGLNPTTLRYYEAIGLLPEPLRTKAGYRLYTDADRERLLFIGKAKAIGLSLEEIREILALQRDGEQPCAHVLALLDRKLVAVGDQLRILQEFHMDLITLRTEAVQTMHTESCVCGIIERHAPSRSTS
ncbi:MAG: Cd(II)/Pb(II)-responsive transcriptional regulator [Herpetosiphon sp.]